MPWSRRDRPSAAVGALVAYVRRERPALEVCAHSEFLEVAERLSPVLYDAVSLSGHRIGELLYTPLLYAERRPEVRAAFATWAAERASRDADLAAHGAGRWDALFDRTLDALAAHVEQTARRLAARHPIVVGLTTCFGQLFANLALARALKTRAPKTRIVLGGSTVSSRVGPSLLTEHPFLDGVVQGEGELPFVALLDALCAPRTAGRRTLAAPRPRTPGLLLRDEAAEHPRGAELAEVESLDALPYPDFDEYAERAERHSLSWSLPVEGSRGCWWDRTSRTGDPTDTCHFCNLNVQWRGYREKSAARVAAEVDALVERYRRLGLDFVDNVLRHRGVGELAAALTALGRQLDVFYELRASVRPLELLAMWEAGLRRAQIGIEGLSGSLLRRTGKGTTVAQNLQAMRLCAELGVDHGSNLIVDFPGSTDAEVAETVETIERHALSYQPVGTSEFFLGMDATVETCPERFGVRAIRNHEHYRPGLPDDVFARLKLLDRSFDLVLPPASWTPVRQACARWEALHGARREPLLVYRDGGSFLVVEDERHGSFRSGTFVGLERELYLFCTEIRTRSALERRFSQHASAAAIDDLLAWLAADSILFREGDHCLALAIATSPALAARRIREARSSR